MKRVLSSSVAAKRGQLPLAKSKRIGTYGAD